MRARWIVLLSCAGLFGQEYLAPIPVDHPAIQYFQNVPSDRVAALSKRMEAGAVKLASRPDPLGYLPSLLEHLGIPTDSQALVFSKTSFQSTKISPANPRAVYFSDDVAVAYVRGGDGLEVAATDPKLGTVFYTFNVEKSGEPKFTRRDVCLKCHQGPATFGVPGPFVGSVFPGPTGVPAREGAIITDHRTAFKDRWGGWYVNAKRGEQRDRANAVASNPSDPDVLDTNGAQNLTNLIGRFNPAGYLSGVSDIVALMTFEHQTQMINYMTRVGWEAKIAEQGRNEQERMRLQADVDAMVRYMIFAEEVPLKEPIEGVSTFTKTFPQRGPRDAKGRSLRDFDLQKRLFRYPLSYMIYSAQFDALPEQVREQDLPEGLRFDSVDRTAGNRGNLARYEAWVAGILAELQRIGTNQFQGLNRLTSFDFLTSPICLSVKSVPKLRPLVIRLLRCMAACFSFL